MLRFMRRAVLVLLIIAAVFLVVPILMRVSVQPYMYTSVDSVPQAEAALVLGASVSHGKPSPILGARADAAIALYKAGKVQKILVSGDNGALSYDEVTPVRDYLLKAGIPAGDIFLDHAGFDTYSSTYRAQKVFEAQSVVIVTQDFHLPRAVYLARHLGLTSYVLVAEGGEHSFDEYLREIPASLKALMDVAMKREPKFLGPAIPLTGDGSTTWY